MSNEWKSMEDNPIVFEQQLLSVSEVFVYRVPPMQSSKGHVAESWGLDKPALTGSLKVIERGDVLFLEIYDPKTITEAFQKPALFCSCPVRLDEGKPLYTYFDTVVDSSRYFVVRAEDQKTKRAASIGIGFRDRQIAFDLKAVLDDFEKRYNRSKQAEERQILQEYSTPDNQEEELGPVQPMQDLSIKEGEKIVVKIAGGNRRSKRQTGGGLLPPPPGSGSVFTSPSGLNFPGIPLPSGSSSELEGESANITAQGLSSSSLFSAPLLQTSPINPAMGQIQETLKEDIPDNFGKQPNNNSAELSGSNNDGDGDWGDFLTG